MFNEPEPMAWEEDDSFLNISIEDMNYLYLLVFYNRYKTPLMDELKAQFRPFGDDLGDYGKVVKAFDSAITSTMNEVLSKPGWPKKIRKRLEEEVDPFMLVVDRDFKEFLPDQHPWSILWFSDYRDHPDSIYRMFAKLAKITRNDENIFDYLKATSMKRKFKRFMSYFDIKPGIWGFSVDIKKALLDALGI